MSNCHNRKSNAPKAIAWLLVIVLILAALASSITALVMGAKNNGWFEKDETEEVEETDSLVVTPANTKTMSLAVTPFKTAATALTAISTSSSLSDSYTITATVTPSDSTNQNVTWSMAWASTNSATVTDYLTLTSSGLTATVTCEQAFSTQIIITCTSVDNSSVKATCTVDYVKKITDCSFSWWGSAAGVYLSLDQQDMLSESSYNIIENLSYLYIIPYYVSTSTCTISDSYTVSAKLVPNSNFVSLLTGASSNTIDCTSMLDVTGYGAKQGTGWIAAKSLITNMFGSSQIGTSSFYNACVSAYTSLHYPCAYLNVTVLGTYSSFTASYPVYIDPSAVSVSVTAVSLNASSLVF